MKVYLLEVGCYSDRYVAGVYSTPEKAMAAHTPDVSKATERDTYTWGPPEFLEVFDEDYNSTLTEERQWRFDADWGDAATVVEVVVDA